MTKINDGGPAFPSTEYDSDGLPKYFEEGMQLRDYIAVQAINGLLLKNSSTAYYQTYATAAYKFADAMIKARSEGGEV